MTEQEGQPALDTSGLDRPGPEPDQPGVDEAEPDKPEPEPEHDKAEPKHDMAELGRPSADGPNPEDPEQRASWLELFFDLVVVVAVAMIAERTHEHDTLGGVGQSAVMYAALWMVWTAFMLYANVEGERAHRRAILIGMACIAVMAAAIPEVGHGRDVAFAVAYIVGRSAAMQSLAGSGKAVLDWPVAQQGGGLVPFVIGFWVDAPARYYLWAAGILVDLVFSMLASRGPEAMLRRIQQGQQVREERRALGEQRASERQRRMRAARQRSNRHGDRDGDRRSDRHGDRQGDGRRDRRGRAQAFQIARVNRPHLGERLGLFTIIVLGEAVTQIVTATTEIDWSWPVAVCAVASFLALIGLWWLTFQYGFTGSPQEQVTRLRAGIALPVHLISTAGVVGLSVGLGAAVAHGGDGVPGGLRWVGCAALALYVIASGVGGALSGAPRGWLLGWPLPAAVAPIVLAIVWRGPWPGWILAVLLAAVIGWMVCYGPVRRWLTPEQAHA